MGEIGENGWEMGGIWGEIGADGGNRGKWGGLGGNGGNLGVMGKNWGKLGCEGAEGVKERPQGQKKWGEKVLK